MDFANAVLARVTQSTKAAQEAKRKRAASQALAVRKAQEEKAQAEKQAIRLEADKMLRRGANRKNGLRSAIQKKKRRPRGDSAPQNPAQTHPRPKPRLAPRPSGPPKPLPGMEFVVRREKKKTIRVPHPSDYSDLFGDEYLKGIDLKCVTSMKDESAKATKEAQQILAERKEKAEKFRREAENSRKRELELEKRGIKPKDKNEWRRKAAENDWVAVDVPPATLSPEERAAIARAGPSSIAKKDGASSSASAPVRQSKAAVAAIRKSELAQRSRALKDRVLAATGGTMPKSKVARSADRDERSPVPGKRKLSGDVDRERDRDYDRRGGRERDGRSREVERRSNFSPPPKRSRHERERDRFEPSNSRGYNSEEWSDQDESDDDSEDLFGLEALEREEERSSRLAALEDKRERKLEMQRKKEKERKRKEFELSHRI